MKIKILQTTLVVIFYCVSPYLYKASPELNTQTSPLWQQIAVIQGNLETHGVLGSVIAISKPGTEVQFQSSGFVDIKQHHAMDNHRLFQIGSQTKMFTAAAILLLENQGKLKLSNKVSSYFEDSYLNPELTIKHLLTHSGGIGDSIVLFDPPASRPDYKISFSDHMMLGRAIGEQFEPGTGWEYNNLGFIILGKIAEQVSKKPLYDFLREQIFVPLKMQDTYLGSIEKWPESKMARGYFKSKSESLIDTTHPDLSWASHAGDMISSAGDMLKWFKAIEESDNTIGLTLDSFRQTVVDTHSEGAMAHYGLGIMERNENGTLMWGHGGNIHGYVTLTLVDPRTNIIVNLMTNLKHHPDNLLPLLESSFALVYHLALLETRIIKTDG